MKFTDNFAVQRLKQSTKCQIPFPEFPIHYRNERKTKSQTTPTKNLRENLAEISNENRSEQYIRPILISMNNYADYS